MKQFASKVIIIFFALAIFAALVSLSSAQSASSITQISTSPNGLYFSVDGTIFTSATGSLWPAGSKHTLFAMPTQYSLTGDTQYNFQNWQWSGGTVAGGNTVTVTADPSISSYQALYTTSYAVTLVFPGCPSNNCGANPNIVYVNGAPFTQGTTVFVSAGGSVIVQAFPGSGYVFGGWGSGFATNLTQGFQETIPVNQPISIYPNFQIARTINFATVLQGASSSSPGILQILQDRTPFTTPGSIQWGYGSSHFVGVVSPQSDTSGTLWVFNSWSDGGASTHTYTVAPVPNPDTLTATYVLGALVTLTTNPPGLKLTVDGQSAWPSYNFTWGVGQTHTISAPAQQTDAQGHIWNFSGWSTGGTAAQTITVPASAATAGLRMNATYTAVAQLTVNSAVAGASLTVNGAPCSLPCSLYPAAGTQVDVAAPPSIALSPVSREDFLSWNVTGATATGTAANGDLLVTLGSDPVTVSPVYHLMNYLAAASNPATGANLSQQPFSPDGYYDSQATVTVKASVLPGYKFNSWAGDLSGPTPVGSLPMSSPRSVTAMLTPVPYVIPTGVLNGAGVTPQAVVAPGSVVSVFGANLAGSVATGPQSPMVQTLAGVTARVGAEVLPLYFVSPTQLNVQLPPDLQPGTQTLTISSPGVTDAQSTFQVVADAPGLFPSSIANGLTFGIVLHADGTAVTSDSPAQAGETVTLLGTGFGPTAPARPEGFAVPSAPVYVLTDPATIQLGGISVPQGNAYALPGSVGVDAIQFVVPTGLPSGAPAALTLTINSVTSNTIQLPIQ